MAAFSAPSSAHCRRRSEVRRALAAFQSIVCLRCRQTSGGVRRAPNKIAPTAVLPVRHGRVGIFGAALSACFLRGLERVKCSSIATIAFTRSPVCATSGGGPAFASCLSSAQKTAHGSIEAGVVRRGARLFQPIFALRGRPLGDRLANHAHCGGSAVFAVMAMHEDFSFGFSGRLHEFRHARSGNAIVADGQMNGSECRVSLPLPRRVWRRPR